MACLVSVLLIEFVEPPLGDIDMTSGLRAACTTAFDDSGIVRHTVICDSDRSTTEIWRRSIRSRNL